MCIILLPMRNVLQATKSWNKTGDEASVWVYHG